MAFANSIADLMTIGRCLVISSNSTSSFALKVGGMVPRSANTLDKQSLSILASIFAMAFDASTGSRLIITEKIYLHNVGSE